jgi:cytochrome c-type biogenesis protein CcmH/NrfG
MIAFWFCATLCLFIAGLFFIAPLKQLNRRARFIVTGLFCLMGMGSVTLYYQYGALDKVEAKQTQDLIQMGYLDSYTHQGILSLDMKKQLERQLQHNSIDRDILSLLSMDAYQHKHYERAIGYWEDLLKQSDQLTPEEIKTIRFMIAKAHQER